jgi:opacity protein-like surface antigen
MKRLKSRLAAVLIFGLLLMAPDPANAGWFVDLYLGAALAQDEDFIVRTSANGATGSETLKVDFGTTRMFGGRLGYWLADADWLGLALDVSFFQPDAANAEFTVVPISFLYMFRYPKWRFEPYVAFGLGYFMTEVKASLDGIEFSDTSGDGGLDLRAGLAIKVSANFALYAEYRFTHVSQIFSNDISGGNVEIETDLDVHGFIIVTGVSYRF